MIFTFLYNYSYEILIHKACLNLLPACDYINYDLVYNINYQWLMVIWCTHSGRHTIDLLYDGVPVPGSPFTVNVRRGCDPNKCHAFGPGLDRGFVNEVNTFTVETKGLCTSYLPIIFLRCLMNLYFIFTVLFLLHVLKLLSLLDVYNAYLSIIWLQKTINKSPLYMWYSNISYILTLTSTFESWPKHMTPLSLFICPIKPANDLLPISGHRCWNRWFGPGNWGTIWGQDDM